MSEPPKMPPTMLYEKRDRIAIITINRAEAMNAFTPEMLQAMDAAFADFNKDPEPVGGDLHRRRRQELLHRDGPERGHPDGHQTGDELGYQDHTKRPFSDVFKPIIAAVNGYCIAGGLEFLQGTDLRIAAEHATFGLGEVRWGIIPTGGSHIRLPRQIPWAVAMELLLMGRPITAKRAYDIGLVNEVVPLDQLMPTALKWAETICKNGPLAVRTAKEIAVRALALESGFVLEKALGARVISFRGRQGRPARLRRKAPAEVHRAIVFWRVPGRRLRCGSAARAGAVAEGAPAWADRHPPSGMNEQNRLQPREGASVAPCLFNGLMSPTG